MIKRFVLFNITFIIILASLAGCTPASPDGQGLVLEQHLLARMPQTEPLQFKPVQGSMQEILLKHAEEREKYLALQTSFMEVRSTIKGELDGKTLLAARFVRRCCWQKPCCSFE